MSIKPVAGTRKPSPNDHLLRVARRVLTLPWALVRSVYRGVVRLLRSRMSPRALRDEDQRRQSRARRTLRGLTPDHDPDTRSGTA